ncbi:MAG: hypothetical protein WA952_08440 [Lewinella sp.]
MYGKLFILFFSFLLTGCAALKEQTFAIGGSEVAFSVPQQFESNTFRMQQESSQPNIEQNMKDRGLPVSLLKSVKFASITLQVDSDDPNFDIGSIEQLLVTIALDDQPAMKVATGSFSGFSGKEALLELEDTELLDLLSAESAVYTLEFTVDELPGAPIEVAIDPEFQVTTSIL